MGFLPSRTRAKLFPGTANGLRLAMLLIWAMVFRAPWGHAQSPKLSLGVDAGLCRTFITYIDAYANDYQRNQFCSNVSLSTAIRLGRHIYLVPEAGVTLTSMRFNWQSSRARMDLVFDMLPGYVSISPQLDFRPDPRFSIRPGFSVLFSTFTFGGFYRKVYTDTGFEITDFAGSITSIRNRVVWGPRLVVSFQITRGDARPISMRIGGMIVANPFFGPKINPLAYNPYQYHLTTGVSYALFKPENKP